MVIQWGVTYFALLYGRLGSDVIGGRGSDGDCGSDIFCDHYCVGGWARWEAVSVAAPWGYGVPWPFVYTMDFIHTFYQGRYIYP